MSCHDLRVDRQSFVVTRGLLEPQRLDEPVRRAGSRERKIGAHPRDFVEQSVAGVVAGRKLDLRSREHHENVDLSRARVPDDPIDEPTVIFRWDATSQAAGTDVVRDEDVRRIAAHEGMPPAMDGVPEAGVSGMEPAGRTWLDGTERAGVAVPEVQDDTIERAPLRDLDEVDPGIRRRHAGRRWIQEVQVACVGAPAHHMVERIGVDRAEARERRVAEHEDFQRRLHRFPRVLVDGRPVSRAVLDPRSAPGGRRSSEVRRRF